MTKIQFTWLGPPAIELDGHPLRLEMRKTLALLAYISLSPQSTSRETLADLLWPEFDQQHSLANLRRNLNSLTRSLPFDLIEIDRERVGLRKGSGIQVDVDQFRGLIAQASEHAHSSGQVCFECRSILEMAIGVYRGNFFEGFNLKDCPDFDEWQFYQREGLRSAYAGALERLAGYYQETCEWERAITHARSWLALDRLHEPAQRFLMRLYSLSGQKSAALRQYEECERILEEELGQPPEPETQDLYQEICEAASQESNHRVDRASGKDVPFVSPVPLLKTKLFLPKVPRTILRRPRLVSRLNQCVDFRLTLISASAGFGKTTLLAEWAEQAKDPVAWIALDPDDNDEYRLLNYIIHAVKTIFPKMNFGHEVLQPLLLRKPVPPSDILSSLINELTSFQKPILLVFDDYHVITSPAAGEVIQYLLDHCPPSLHLIISSRTEPSLSLARIRANCQMAEIRTDDLRFKPLEAQNFLTQLLGFHLSPQDLVYLAEKTEGWIAGIQMTAIAIQPNPSFQTITDIHEFIHNFQRSHRYILDYLIEEVLDRQPEEIRNFLLQTSILDKMCWDLCDFLLAESEPSLQHGSMSCQQILEYLERNNLFLIPLDDERKWYRFHHLFADLLHARLRHYEPRREAVLHRRAAIWHAQNSYPAEAIRHASAAGDPLLTADYIEKFASMYIDQSEITLVRDWINSLPAEIAHSRPWLILYQTWIHARLGQMEKVEKSLLEVEQLLESRTSYAKTEEMKDIIAMFRAYQANLSGDTELAIHIAHGGALNTPEMITTQNYEVFFQLGYAYYTKGDLNTADRIFQRVKKSAEEAGDIYNTIISQVELGGNQLIRGSLTLAEMIYTQALDWMRGNVRNPAILDSILNASLAAVEYERNHLTTAAQLVQEAIESAKEGKRTNTLAYALSILAYLYLANFPKVPGNLFEARTAIEQALQHIQSHKTYPRTASQVNTCLVKIWLVEGNLEEAQKWAQHEQQSMPSLLPFDRELEHIAIAQVYLALQKWVEAFHLLERLAEQAMLGGRYGRLLKINVLQALACQGMGNIDEAFFYLAKSLSLAKPEGYLRTFLDEGFRSEELLRLGKEKGIWQPLGLSRYTDKLISSFVTSEPT